MTIKSIAKAEEIELVATRAKKIAEFCGCNAVQTNAAAQVAKSTFLYGNASKGNAICAGVRVARRWKRHGIGVVKGNTIPFPRRVAQMRALGA